MTLASWQQVEAEAKRIGALRLQDLAARASVSDFVWSAPHLEADVAKQPIDADALAAMQKVAKERGLPQKIRALFTVSPANSGLTWRPPFTAEIWKTFSRPLKDNARAREITWPP